MLGQSAMMSPFAVALASAKYLLVIPNCQRSIYTRLWCVFEAHLALQLGLEIRLPSKPACSHVAFALLPRFALTALVAFLQSYYMRLPGEHSWEMFTVRISMVVWLGVSVFMPTCDVGVKNKTLANIFTTWFSFLLVGCGLGVTADIFSRPTPGDPLYFHRGLGITLFFSALVEQSLRGLAAAAVTIEGEQLEFESVQYASCSDAEDELKIREAIAGNEELLDSAIRTLRGVGQYNQDIHKTLRLGVPADRLRRGPASYSLTVLAGLVLVRALFTPLCTSESLAALAVSPIYDIVLIHVVLPTLLLCFVFCFCPEPKILVCDSLLLLGMAMGVCFAFVNLWYTGDKLFTYEVVDEEGRCEQIPWYAYPAIIVPFCSLWLCSLPLLYGGVIRSVTSRFSPDGMLVAESYYYVGHAAQGASEEESDAESSILLSHRSCCESVLLSSSGEDSTEESTEDSKIATA
eukprot:TRINITY_DN3052_c0_g2_i1.p1 TRINITY_DN3052_c0_g2~~TRINITY_DN3052_c0_g2_i1.p1  ORF type:complete len:462 (+),score=25.08 TRINITY_DN3052_c0_g2_i1:950-2335(+)